MSKNLVFIMSDSEAYLRDEVIRIYTNWGFEFSNVKVVEEWNPALVGSSVSLFGDTSMIHLDLSDKNKLKSFADLISSKDNKKNFKDENWFGPGLIITSIHARGAKKIENLVKKFGGRVQKKAKPEEMRNLLINRVNLNRKTADFLETYVGEDYQILVGIVNQLEKLNESDQQKMTIDELIVRLPTKPGSVPPWDFINPMLNGNAKEAVNLYTRAVEGSHILVTMKLSRSKLQLLYRLKLLQRAGIWKSQDQAKILGEKNGPNIWITAKSAQKVNVDTAEYLAKLALVTEANLKGHSNADPNIIFTNFIAAVCLAIKYNKPMPLSIR